MTMITTPPKDDGMLYVVYNMGKVPQRIDSKSTIYSSNMTWKNYKVNDGKYHVVRFVRTSQNSALEIDDNPLLTKQPQGKSFVIPNDLCTLPC